MDRSASSSSSNHGSTHPLIVKATRKLRERRSGPQDPTFSKNHDTRRLHDAILGGIKQRSNDKQRFNLTRTTCTEVSEKRPDYKSPFEHADPEWSESTTGRQTDMNMDMDLTPELDRTPSNGSMETRFDGDGADPYEDSEARRDMTALVEDYKSYRAGLTGERHESAESEEIDALQKRTTDIRDGLELDGCPGGFVEYGLESIEE